MKDNPKIVITVGDEAGVGPEIILKALASKEALLSYKASLKVLPLELVKLCVAVINSFLNDVHIKLPLNAILQSPYKLG